MDDVKILIQAEDEASQVLNEVSTEVDSFSNEVKKASDSVVAFSKRNEETFTSMRNYGTVAFAALVGGAGLAIDAFAESEAQLVRVDTTLKNIDLTAMGSSFDEAAQKARDFGTGLQNLTGIGDEAAAEGFAKLLKVTNDYGEATKLATLAADLSVAKQIDYASATKIVAMATTGNTRVLKEYGIELEEGATKQEIIGALMGTVAGQAEAFGRTMEGQGQIINQSFGDVMESVGGALAPAFAQLQQAIIPVLQSFAAWASENPTLIANIILIGGVVSGLVAGLGILGLAIPAIVTGFSALGVAFAFLTGPIGLVVGAITLLTGLIIANRDTIMAYTTTFVSYLTTTFQGLWDMLMVGRQLFSALFTTDIDAFWLAVINIFNTYILVMTTIWTTLWNVVRSIFTTTRALIKAALTLVRQELIGIITAAVNFVINIFNTSKELVLGAFTAMFDGVGAIAKGVMNGVIGFIEAGINKAIDMINSLIQAANAIAGSVGISIALVPNISIARLAHGGIAGMGSFGGDAQQFAAGGVVEGGKGVDKVPAMLSAGELVLNAAQQQNVAAGLQSGKGSSIVVNISGNNFYGDDSSFAQKIGDTILEEFKSMYSFESF